MDSLIFLISVVVPSYNSVRTIGRTLDSLLGQKRADLITEIIVVDSSDDSATKVLLASREAGKIRVIHAGTRVMPAAGRNAGARAAQGALLVFIDSDAYMAEDWVERVAKARSEGSLLGSGSISLPPFQEKTPIAAAQHFLQFNEYMNTGELRPVDFVPSCNLFCDRELFFKAGGFPEIRASEDVMFCLRAGRLARVWFLPEARVYHIFREEKKSFLNNQKMLGRYILIYRRLEMKNRFYYRGAWPLVFLPGFAAIKTAKIVGRIFRAGKPSVGRFFMALPLFLQGLGAWMAGFASAVFSNAEETQARSAEKFHKNLAKSALIFAIALSAAAPTLAQEAGWEFTGWCGGGAFPAVVADPNVASRVYLVSDVSGVWRSDDRGDKWNSSTSGLNTLSAVTIAVSKSEPDVVYLGTRNGVLRSDNAGASWHYLPATKDTVTFRRPANYKSLATHPAEPSTVYAGNERGEVYVSKDAGASWKRLEGSAYPFNSKVPVSAILLTADGRHLFAGSEKGLARYDIAKKKWKPLDPAEALDLASVATPEGETIYAPRGKHLAWSTDLGNTWRESSSLPIAAGSINRLDVRPGRDGKMKLLAAWRDNWNGGLYLSEDSGASWVEVERGLEHDFKSGPTRTWAKGWGWPLSASFDPFDSSKMYFSDFWGVWRSDDNGASWQERIEGAGNSVGSDIVVSPNGTILVATMDNGLVESQDGGTTYKAVCPVTADENDVKGHVWRVLALGNGKKLIATNSPWDSPSNQILLSDDGGRRWRRVKTGLPAAYPRINTVWDKGYARALAADPTDPNRLYLGIDGDDGGGFFYSMDGGNTWTRPETQPDSLRVYNALAVDPSSPNRLYWGSAGASSNGGIFQSDDYGRTWKKIFSDAQWVFDLAVTQNGNVYAAADAGGPALYASTDKGITWSLLKKFEDGNSACEAVTLDPRNPERIAVATVRWDGATGGKIYLTEDGGKTWTNITGTLPNGAGAAAMAFSRDSGYLYVSRYAGSVYRIRVPKNPNKPEKT